MNQGADAGALHSGAPALRRCVAGDLARFVADYWGRRPLLSRAEDLPASYADLLTLDDADELLSQRGLRTPFLRIAKNGAVVNDRDFTGPGGVGAEIADQVRDDRVAALFASGHTVVLQGLHRVWPPLIDFATQLSSDAGHPVQVNAYITPPQSQGFAAHYDVHDVFVLQVAGEKHWTIHEPVHVDPLRNQPWTDHAEAVARKAADDPPVIDAVIRPGDALYVPRGFLHSAKALGGVSAHLTVGLHTMTRYMLVQELAALASEVPELRAALPLGFDPSDPEQLAPYLREVADALSRHARSLPLERVAERVRRRTWTGNRPAPLAPLAHAAAIGSLGPESVVRVRRGVRTRVVPGDPVLLQLPDRTMSLPGATVARVRRLCSGDAVRVGDDVELVRRLMTDGVLVTAKT